MLKLSSMFYLLILSVVLIGSSYGEEFDPRAFEDVPAEEINEEQAFDPKAEDGIDDSLQQQDGAVETLVIPEPTPQEEPQQDLVSVENEQLPIIGGPIEDPSYSKNMLLLVGFGVAIICLIIILLAYSIHYYREGKHLSK